jgi:hypothetical protein
MSVISCFYRVASQFPILRDPEFFLIYFRTFIFDDLELVDLLLDENYPIEKYAARLRVYVRQRLRLFMLLDHQGDAKELERWLLQAKQPEPSDGNATTVPEGEYFRNDIATIANDPECKKRALKKINGKIRALLENASLRGSSDFDKSFRGSMSTILATLIESRTVLRLFSREIWVLNRNGNVLLLETKEAYLDASEGRDGNAILCEVPDKLQDGPAFVECVALQVRLLCDKKVRERRGRAGFNDLAGQARVS